MSLAIPPEFREMSAGTPECRSALMMAGIILDAADTSFETYPRHCHDDVVVANGQVLFEMLVIVNGQRKLKVFPMDEARAKKLGKPSVWAFAPGENGEAKIYVLRYAANALYEGRGVDVESAAFQIELRRMANAFVAEGIHELLELNLVGYLFPPPAGMLTRERTFDGYHLVDHAPIPSEILAGDWTQAACFSFRDRQPVVTGWCAGTDDSCDVHTK